MVTADKIRVLSCCEWFDERGFGQSLAARGLSVHLPERVHWEAVVRQAPSGHEQLGVKIHYLPHNRVEGALRLSRALIPAMLSLRPHVVHLHALWTGMIGLIPLIQRLGAKVLVSPHGMASADLRGLSHNWKKALVDAAFQKRCLRLADHFHALNDFEARAIRDYVGVEPQRITIIPNGIELPELPVRHTRHQKPRFLYMGRFHHGKRVLELLQAWQQGNLAEHAELVLAGGGDWEYSDRVREKAHHMSGVTLPGYVSGRAKEELLSQSDYTVLFSQSEGLPMATLEGLAHGLPPLVSDHCRMNEAATACGWMASSVAELQAHLQRAATLPPEQYRARSERALAYVKRHHDWHRIGEELATTYESLRAAR